MFKGLKPISYAGKEVWPLIEGGKGVSATNHASSGAWAAAGGIGTVSAVNADSYDPEGRIIPQIYHGMTRRERHEELIKYAIDGAVQQGTCTPSGSCLQGPPCGDDCCGSGERCIAGEFGPVCACGQDAPCEVGQSCETAGPVGEEQASRRWRLPRMISALVPTSTTRLTSSRRWGCSERMTPAASAPTWPAMQGST